MTERNWVREFRRAESTFDWAATTALAKEYAAHLYGVAELPNTVAKVLLLLRQNLRYEDLEEVADAALAHGVTVPGVRRQYAQALVDAGNPAVALRLYTELADDATAPEPDRTEARGGMGRCYKELFLACTHPERRLGYLGRALDAYLEAYDENTERTWHGINAVALLARAEREGLDVADRARPLRTLADAILAEVDGAPVPDSWTEVTACEALIGLGRPREAIERAKAFLETKPDAFVIAAFLRQLRAVWRLDTFSSPGNELLPVLRSALLRHDGGQVVVESVDVRASRLREMGGGGLEKVLGSDRYQSLTWYRNGLARCRAVARIQNRNEDGVGTGFLVAGPDLHPSLPPLVLLTNAHVVPEELDPADAVVVFHGLDQDEGEENRFGVVRQWWHETSKAPGVDTAVLELSGYPADVVPVPLAKALPVKPFKNRRAYVIGHPRGLAQPQFSLQDNILLDYDDRVLHYRSPTEGGSSGSPVFDSQWNLVGLHHAGGFDVLRLNNAGGTYAANEGISVRAIRERLECRPPRGG